MSDDCVRVAVRIRPLVKSEIDKGCRTVITKVANEPQILVKINDAFTFNYVFDPEYPQKTLYEDAVQSMLQKLFEGYNVTILAYGQTGSGKTHTMGTTFSGNLDEDMGVIPRAMYDIFKKVNEMSSEYEFKITCSFMELYQEQLYDLLSTQSREQSVVDIREDGNKGIIIPGLTEINVDSAIKTTNCLMRGASGRAVGSTAMNQQSSRSHAIFTITICKMKTGNSSNCTTSKFHLVDLAGSERQNKTKATGERFKEGVKINQGLLALGNVISALGIGQSGGYIGYRDSKLTRLLQDSLGGNSVTLMIACVSPADYNMDETLSTLRYADRARKIKNKPIINQDPQIAEINRLNALVSKLRLELLSNGGGKINDVTTCKEDFDLLKKQNFILNEKNRSLQQKLQSTLIDVAENEMRAVLAESAQEKLQLKFNQIKGFIYNLNEEFNHNNVDNIRVAIDEIEGIFNESKHEQKIQKLSLSLINANDSEETQIRSEAFTTKQLDFNDKLKLLNQELHLKEEHHQKIIGNLTQFKSYEDNYDQVCKESESKIQVLEAEKSELLDKLKCIKDNASAKIAEERRKRLQQLEIDINDLKKRNLQQAKMLKIREKEAQKITNLTIEIQDMKATKVKLVRAMKSESESFRQWKLDREKQLTQLKAKDRKMQTEMAKKEMLHSKQKTVWKRKVEEAMLINKRLKVALDKQKIAQSQRKINGTQTSKVDQFIKWIDNEIELVSSVIDAKNSIELLIEDRTEITKRLRNLIENEQGNYTEIESLEEDIQRRNAQIDDLQQKIAAFDIESKLSSICSALQTLPEARAALQHLFNVHIDLKQEYCAKESKIEELKSQCEMFDEKFNELQSILNEKQHAYRQETLDMENKITTLLNALNNGLQNPDEISPEALKIQQEKFNSIETMQDQIENYEKLINDYESQLKNNRSKKKSNSNQNRKLNELQDLELAANMSLLEESFEDDSNDPDWVKTPLFKRPARAAIFGKKSTSINSDIDELNQNASNASKRSSSGKIKCSCKRGCSTKRCKCKSNTMFCSSSCGCDSNECVNQGNNESQHGEEEQGNKENLTENNDSNSHDSVVVHTPKKLKTGIDSLKDLDVTTPIYPFSVKKRKPYYE